MACRTPADDGLTLRLPPSGPLAVEFNSSDAGDSMNPDSGLTGCGVACDIGTTTVVCHLVDLSTGRILATAGEGNAQRPYGADVIARIKASMDGMRPALTAAVTGQLSRMIEELCRSAGVSVDNVNRMAVAANTTMCHLLAGLPPDSIGAAPFTPTTLFGDCRDAKLLGFPFDGDGASYASNSALILSDHYARGIATLQLFPSPYEEGRAVLVCSAAAREGFDLVSAFLEDDAHVWSLSGDTVLIDRDLDIKTYALQEDKTQSRTPILRRLMEENRDSTLFSIVALSVMLLLLLCVVLVAARAYWGQFGRK